MATQPRPPSLEVIYTEVKDRLAAQLHQVDTLDLKAGTVLSIASLVMTIAAGFQVSFRRGTVENLPLSLLIAGAFLYAITMFFAFRGYWVRNFRRDPEPAPLRDRYLFQNPDFTKRRIIANVVQSFRVNSELITSKVWNIRLAIIFLAAQTLILVAALIAERVVGGEAMTQEPIPAEEQRILPSADAADQPDPALQSPLQEADQPDQALWSEMTKALWGRHGDEE